MWKIPIILTFGLASANEQDYQIVSCNDQNKDSLQIINYINYYSLKPEDSPGSQRLQATKIRGLYNHCPRTKDVKFTNCGPFRE